jgi:hypothetical protein
MLKLIITMKDGAKVDRNFSTQEELDQYKKEIHDGCNWGKPEHQHELTPRQVIHHDEVPAKFDEVLGTSSPKIDAYDEVIEATFQTIPSEYTIEQVDITQEVEAERVKKETKHSDRINRVGSLKNIDWQTIDTIAELKNIVKILVKESIKDDE